MKWLSRKLIAAVVTAILTPLLLKWGIPQDTVNHLIQLVIGYILGQSAVDMMAAFKATAASAAIAKGGGADEVKAAEGKGK